MDGNSNDSVCNEAYELLRGYCKEYKMLLTPISNRHFRLTHGKNRLDVFPLGKKYFNLNIQKWGEYQGDIIEFVDNHFANL